LETDKGFFVFSSGDTEPEPKPEVKAKPNPDIPDLIIQSIRHKHRYANACAIQMTAIYRERG
ncbi:hypothetical protein ACR79T_18065, partial [Sphingobacterium spiritivorum]|uniref:hypothetical protein n=1 Tax=Sphingobacterium spiritivorum TaxID=258 RepID=UPI003DA52418